MRGDMSVVGPRPIRPAFFEELCEEIPQYWQRLVVRPGHHRLRAAAHDARDDVGREARARPRVHRRPLGARCTCGSASRPRWRDLSSPAPSRARRRRPLAMCGICGLVCLDGGGADPAVARGDERHARPPRPGQRGLVRRRTGRRLATRRLSIIDLAGGDQPIAQRGRPRAGGAERRDLQLPRAARASWRRAGTASATDSDTEVLVHLYEEHGAGFVERLRGMFAIAVWDRRERRLVLARDRFGIKPLYYRVAGGDALVRLRAEGAAAPAGRSPARWTSTRSRRSSRSTRSRRR